MWIATGNGLNKFNGKTVEKFFASEYPQMQNSDVLHVTCDSNNRIWGLTLGGHVFMLDEKRQMHRVGLYLNNEILNTRWILNLQKGNIILFTAKGFYAFNPQISLRNSDSLTIRNFTRFVVKNFDTLQTKGFRQVFHYDDEHVLFVINEEFYKVNFKTLELERKYSLTMRHALIKWGANSLLAQDRSNKKIEIINLDDESISYPFQNLTDQYGKPVDAQFNFAIKIRGEKYVFTTQQNGIYIYDQLNHSLSNYRHHYADPSSLGTDFCTVLAAEPKGWVFVSTSPAGLSYFYPDEIIHSKLLFTDNKGKGFDGNVSGMATLDNNIYYLGTTGGMIEWNRNTNSTHFFEFKKSNGKSAIPEGEVVSITFDNSKKLWAGGPETGVFVLDQNKKLLKHFINDPSDKKSLIVKRVGRVLKGPDGFIWVCGRNGISRINPENFQIDNFENTPLATFHTMHVTPLLFTDSHNLWIAASFDGLFHYNLSTKILTEFESFKPFKKDGILDFQSDTSGNLYIGNRGGLHIIFNDGRVKLLTQKNGLLIDRVEGILRDRHNRLWLGNDIGLSCYNPADSGLKTFDVRYGLSIYGFWVGAYFQMPNGEFFFGTPHGLQYFHPDSLYNKKTSLDVSVTKIETKKFVSTLSGSENFRLKATDNQVTFHFGTVDYSPYLRTFYEYKLEDLDKDWIKIADQNSVRYNSLPPGKYIFKVRASSDNMNWTESDNIVTIAIAVPFYGTWWFKILAFALALYLIRYVIRYFQKKQRQEREELETELVINYFASQINSRYNTDELLWDVAKNLIGKLGFEDCMIYLWNDDKTILIQKAGYGSKGSMQSIIDRTVYNIPKGRGIVGAVTNSKQSLMVNDTSKDKRYFTADGKIMLSELCVPLIYNNEVLGAINTEHRHKNFFSLKHLKMLSTIAVLCANQLQRIRAEEEKQQARIEALQNKQKATETRLQSLRLQMNPHFLFNALNSIQQMILANEEMVATKYLSKFSKLLRAILIHSDKETISLKEEMDILKLYVELESIRFKDSFQYQIICDEEIDADEVKIPTLLVQPFVENAIWHGLMHKEGERRLRIHFTEETDFIKCVIEDNGIGRKKAAEIKMVSGETKKHTSKGIAVSKERLKTLSTGNGKEGDINIIDLGNNGEDSGTRVEIIFPIQN